MGSLRLALCTGWVAVAALTPTACPVAYAAAGGISVTPSPPEPGSDIQVRAEGCEGKTGTASSKAFVADALLIAENGGLVGETRVRSTLRPGAYQVRVTCDGVEDKIKTRITVVRRGAAAAREGAPDPSAEALKEAAAPDPPAEAPKETAASDLPAEAPKEAAAPDPSAEAPKETAAPDPSAEAPKEAAAPAPPASPVAPVRAGGGGAARFVAAKTQQVDARSEGPGTRQAVVGLVLAGVAALAVVLRGVRKGRGTE